MSSPIQDFSFITWSSPSNLQLTDETLASCWCSPSVLRKSGSIWSTRSISKAPTLMRLFGSTLLCWHRKTGACELMAFSRASIASSSAASVTRSVLFSRMRSAKATCSTASFSTPSGFSSSKCCRTCFASTTVMIPSSLYIHLMSSSTKNVCATGAGSASPVVSMITASNFCTFSCSLLRDVTRSLRTVQQMQPFMTSIISSSTASEMTFSSTPTSPNSFSTIANLMPWSGE
mmetsp:Transcript_59547/g.159546  ORF Transcript_59547/g.159546 Transcript_59547/m.159546 type:complete len:232 (-) Transcript_59547:186-881(-)